MRLLDNVGCMPRNVMQGRRAQGRLQTDTSQLRALWVEIIEEGMFASSHERQALGLQLFALLLPYLG